jgi:2-polyprenyl-3-methyl-5-hydroxy-6-metoxy-1,4-benzoquinol methylase
MSEFDARALDWDSNPIHWDRSKTIAENLLKRIPSTSRLKAMEYGAGTGILSFLLSDSFAEITLMDNSNEMVKVMQEKVAINKLNHLKPLFFDIEHSDYQAQTFDCIFSQMVLHHIADTKLIINKFCQLLNPGGYLAIADLHSEDGSFHGMGFNGHNGFDVEQLTNILKLSGFRNISSQTCYTVKKPVDDVIKDFPIFLLIAQKAEK